MGIRGLLGVLKPVLISSHISNYSGKRVGVDAYSWLHKGVYGCCFELCNNIPTRGYITYCLNLIDLLIYHSIDVVMVFDGDSLPMKGKTETERAENRQQNLSKGHAYLRDNDQTKARNYFSRAVDVTPLMAGELILAIKSSRPSVQCLVAPYEADAQLAFLSHHKIIDAVVSEDSDNIPYGCSEIIFKLDKLGNCQTIRSSELFSDKIPGFELAHFTQEMIVMMCVAAGCDYLDSVKGVGLKNSYKIVSKERTVGNCLRSMRMSGMIPLINTNLVTYLDNHNNLRCCDRNCLRENNSSENTFRSVNNVLQYELDFYKAIATFSHQVVFDPRSRQCVYLNPIKQEDFHPCLNVGVENEYYPYLGQIVSPELACQISDGLIDPTTKKPFQFDLSKAILSTNNKKQNIIRRANTTSVIPQQVNEIRTLYRPHYSKLNNNMSTSSNRRNYDAAQDFKTDRSKNEVTLHTIIADANFDLSNELNDLFGNKSFNSQQVPLSIVTAVKKSDEIHDELTINESHESALIQTLYKPLSSKDITVDRHIVSVEKNSVTEEKGQIIRSNTTMINNRGYDHMFSIYDFNEIDDDKLLVDNELLKDSNTNIDDNNDISSHGKLTNNNENIDNNRLNDKINPNIEHNKQLKHNNFESLLIAPVPTNKNFIQNIQSTKSIGKSVSVKKNNKTNAAKSSLPKMNNQMTLNNYYAKKNSSIKTSLLHNLNMDRSPSMECQNKNLLTRSFTCEDYEESLSPPMKQVKIDMFQASIESDLIDETYKIKEMDKSVAQYFEEDLIKQSTINVKNKAIFSMFNLES
eukprot:gene6878-9423_t